MRSTLTALATALIGIAAISVPISAAAHDRDDHYNHGSRYDHDWHHARENSWGRDDYHYDRGDYRGPRVIREREIIHEGPRVVYREPFIYERPTYYREPAVTFSIGLPPIIIPFH